MYHLSVVTPVKMVFEGEASSVIAPGTLGYLQILTNHASIITSLKPGSLTITDKNNNRLLYAISGGILEMLENNCTILAYAVEIPAEINVKRAQAAFERAETRLAQQDPSLDRDRAKKALHRAENRLRLAGKEALMEKSLFT